MTLFVGIVLSVIVVAGIWALWSLLTVDDNVMSKRDTDAEYFRRKFQKDDETQQ